MYNTEEENDTMLTKLFEALKKKGQLYNFTIDYGPYEGITTFFDKAQGACSVLNDALRSDAVIDMDRISYGKGVTIDYRDLKDREHITLKYVMPYPYDASNITAGIRMTHEPIGKNGVTEYLYLITYHNCRALPDFVTAFISNPSVYKIPQDHHQDLESILNTKYKHLFKLLRDQFRDKRISLYIKYLDVRCS